MSDHAQKVWIDYTGEIHDTEEEALCASRTHAIGKRMQEACAVDYDANNDTLRLRIAAIEWFLLDPLAIIAQYKDICDAVDKEMRTD